MKQILTIAGVIIVFVFLLGQCTSARADIKQAEAAIEAAKAANTAATGLSVVAGGQTLILVILTVALVVTWCLVLWLLYSRNKSDRAQVIERPRRQPPQQKALQDAGGIGAVDVATLFQLEMLRALREMRKPQVIDAQAMEPQAEQDQGALSLLDGDNWTW